MLLQTVDMPRNTELVDHAQTIRRPAAMVRVRADTIGHARINMYVNLSHAWLKMAD